MDGNRRWAVAQGKNKLLGHKAGADNLKKIIGWGRDYGLRAMTFYTFSTKNFGRSEIEKQALFTLFKVFIKDFLNSEDFKNNSYNLHFLGRIHLFPEDVQQVVKETEEKTKDGKLTLNFCFGYGGKQEIVDACNKAIKEGKEVDEESLNKLMYMQDEPEIVIRTGAQKRTSDFLPWQTAYSEWFFPETFWPALTAKEIEDMIEEFNQRKRNFGK
tara:strand:+ start:339 stop:980 length:642 start_codon:yes stop_codon:yes gene_type:complete